MHDALAALALAAATATPTPAPSMIDPDQVTPGAWGFVITAFVAVLTILLVWDMVRRIRRGRVRADLLDELEAERQADSAVEATETDDEDIAPDEPTGGAKR